MASVTSIGVHQPTALRQAIEKQNWPRDDLSPDLYKWDVPVDPEADVDDELLTTPNCVYWSRGTEFQKCFTFDLEKEPVTQALLTYFPVSEDDNQELDSEDVFTIKRGGKILSKALVVFLRTQAHIFFLSGTTHVVHMPFEVESACAAPYGVIIQRKARVNNLAPVTLKFPRVPPNSFVSSQISPVPNRASSSQQTFSTAAMGKPKTLPLRLSSTLENMWQPPLEKSDSQWPRLVCLTDPLLEIGLVVTQPDKPSRDRKPALVSRPHFLDPAEEILHVEAVRLPRRAMGSRSNDVILAVTVNREASTYSVWRLTYIKNGDQFTSRQKKSKAQSKASRRRSSMQPGQPSGAATPIHPSVRDSFGASLPVKKTRKSERADKSIDIALALDPDKAGEVTRRQSRRVSSLLARADLSASHERSVFADQPSTSVTGSRRVDSHGSYRGRTSSSYVPMNMSGTYNQTLNSLLEAPVDDLLDELRAGGDFEGFHSMGLDDPEFDGLTKEALFTKIRTISMDNTNVRYSLSNAPAGNQCKVFIIAGTPFAVDEQDKNYLLICIQDIVDKRLQLLTLHVQMKNAPDSAAQLGERAAPADTCAAAVTWGQLRRAQNVVDSCKIFDGNETMILILSEGEEGQRQLSVQAPWSELTTITLPWLIFDPLRDLSFVGSLTGKEDKSHGTKRGPVLGPHIKGICHPKAGGLVDIYDGHGLFHQVRIQLQPSTVQVRRVLDACRSVLPAMYAEKMLAGWWHVMQWLQTSRDLDVDHAEWSSLVIQLFTIFLALGHSDASTLETTTPKLARHWPSALPSRSDAGGDIRGQLPNVEECTPNGAACPRWMQTRGWRWLMDTNGAIMSRGGGTETLPAQQRYPSFLSRHISYAKRYMVSMTGLQAIGPSGYLPTAFALSPESRRSAAWAIMLALHLLLEEQKLDILTPENGYPGPAGLRLVVVQIARWLKWPKFVAQYELGIQADVGPRHDSELSLKPPLPEPGNLPCIFAWIQARLTRQNVDKFPTLADVHALCLQLPQQDGPGDGRWELVTPRTFMFQRLFQLLKAGDTNFDVVAALHKCGFDPVILDTLPDAVLAPLQDSIAACQPRPPLSWSKDLLRLVDRMDISMVLKPGRPVENETSNGGESHDASWDFRVICETKDEMNAQGWDEAEGSERQAVIEALFQEDKRLNEAQTMLSTAKPRTIRLDPQPEWTESEYLERQKELVAAIATNTLAIPAGRGMLYYGLRFPLLTQKFNIHGFNLTCLVKPANVVVGVDKLMYTEEKVNWAFFHQGVAYGMTISPQAKGIDTSWILFNKPGNDLNNRHAGFLLALGLNKHLKSVAKWVAFKYLTPKHTMTSIGLLLGLAASHLGTMDSLITRLLSVHVTRMLPRGAAELNLSHQTQTTGIMGIGLLYYNTQHRRMSEIMLSEIEFVEDEDEEDPLRSECYRLSAGFALGYINLGKGNDLKGLHDMRIAEKLLSVASSTKKVELVNVLDRAAPAAVVAIALIYMKTEDHIVARKIDVPDSVLQFDYVRPDILLLRTVAKNLILWSKIEPTHDWIQASLPAEYRGHGRIGEVKGLHTRDLSYFSILVGLCFSMALRFAGSGDLRARDVLLHFFDHFMRIFYMPSMTFDGQMARSGARMCLDLVALSCATVMAGTGDIPVLRRLRVMHGRKDVRTTYGSHLAAHLAIGALFLGSGTSTFGTSNLAIASLLVAFYPIFPTEVQDNRSHLQAFRHFWAFATEPRCLVVRDMASGEPISVPILIRLRRRATASVPDEATAQPHDSASEPTEEKTAGGEEDEEQVLRRETPCLLPPLEDISSVRTDAHDEGYWDLEINFEHDPQMIEAFRANQNLYLRRRPAHASPFTATLDVLAENEIGAFSPYTAAWEARGDVDPLEWVFTLDSLATLSQAERTLVLDNFSGGSMADGGASTTAVDSRVMLEDSIDGWSRDGLLGLRLLFEWADKRDEIGRGARPEQEAEGEEKNVPLGASGPVGHVPESTETEEVNWWMKDNVIDMLKGKVWLAGQDE